MISGVGFDDDVALRIAGPGTFDLDVPAHWRVGRAGTNGGYVAAAVTAAMTATVAQPERRPRSLTVHYLAGCQPGPATIAVTTERAGRSLTALSARMTQGDALVALAIGAFARDRAGLDYARLPMPEAPPPEEVDVLDFAGAGRPGFPANWEYRPCVGAIPGMQATEAISGGWIRPAELRIVDAPLLAAMADAWLPPVLVLMDQPRGIVPTIDLTVHFRTAVPLPDAAPGDWCMAVFESRIGAEGYWESDGTIWSRDGRVLAQARQLALFNMAGA